MNDGLTVQVAEAIGEVMRELLAVAENTPIKPERAAPTARILSGLAGQLRDTAAMLAPRADGSIPAGDERVNRARVLVAEDHEPGDLDRAEMMLLLARYQRAAAGLLAVVDNAADVTP